MSRWAWLIAGLILGADWLRRSLAAVIGMGKLEDLTLPQWNRPPSLSGTQPRITVVVPARNESAKIEQCLRSLLNQDYTELQICAVDDRSSDSTGKIMDELQRQFSARLDVLHIRELPAGWLGKTHAMYRGGATSESDWLLFTDGDVIFRPDAVRRTLTYAELTGCDHLVLFPTLVMKTFGERMMLGFFGLASSLWLRAWKVRDPRTKDSIGVGAFNLIRRRAYEGAGTYQALRMEVIDDLKLGQAVKELGFRQDCVRGPGLVRLHWAEGARGVVGNMQKNLFSLLRFSWPLSVAAAIATVLYHLGPWVGLLVAPGIAKIGFAIGAGAIALLYVCLAQQFELPVWYMLTQPAAALMFVYALLNSAASSVAHGGVAWRGTTYSLDEIRRVSKDRRKSHEEQQKRQATAAR
ncbi:MAG TPA: glycosyltransferase [Terriglobales bacterium]|nr:glycosyltransferase [Terriglobales bacterium]